MKPQRLVLALSAGGLLLALASGCASTPFLPTLNRRIEKSVVPPPKSATSTVASRFSPRANQKAAATGSWT